MTLSDEAVILRAWSPEDAGFMAAMSADPAIRRYNGDHDRRGQPAPPLSRAQAESTIERFALARQAFVETGSPAGVAFAITDASSGELVGCCGVDAWTKEDVAQVGYWIAAGARRRGYASRATILLTRWLFELGAARVFMTIVAGNEASVSVAHRAGFVYEGTMRSHAVWQGRRRDVMWFAALPGEWPTRTIQQTAVTDATRRDSLASGATPLPRRAFIMGGHGRALLRVGVVLGLGLAGLSVTAAPASADESVLTCGGGRDKVVGDKADKLVGCEVRKLT